MIQIPVSSETKAALVEWKSIKVSPDMSKFPNARVANLTGKINNIIVLDIDKPKPDKNEKDGFKYFKQLMKSNPKTLTYKTKSGGRHYYFKYDEDINSSNIGVNGYSIDVLSNKKYAITYDVLYDEPIQTMPANVKEFVMTWRNRKMKSNSVTKKPMSTNKNIRFNYNLADVVDVLNKLPSKYYNDTKLWISVTSALKSANLHAEWEVFSRKSSKYNKDNNESIWVGLTPGVDLTFLNVLIKQEKIKSTLKVHRWCSKLGMFTTKPDEVRNEKYLFDPDGTGEPNFDNFDHDEHSHLLIKSATGTGKTTATANLIQKIRKGYDYRVLSIVSRVSLAQQHKKNFKGMTYYQDIKPSEYSDCKDLVIQLDSIVHLNPNKLKNTILYLDEINSMFDYMLNSTTLKNRRLQVYNMLCMLICSASYVIGVDADMSDIVPKFFKFFDIDTHIIHNKYKNAQGKVTQYTCENKLIADMKAKMKRGEYFICCFDSLRCQDEIIPELKGYCERQNLDCKKDFLIYSSKDGDDHELKDVSEMWKRKYVFYTPKIVYGLDFVPDTPMNVYAFFKCTSVNPLAFSQMTARCRKIKHLRYCIQERNISLRYMNADEIKEDYNDVLKYLETAIDTLDPIPTDVIPKKTEARYMEYDPRTDEITIATSLFDDMWYLQQYYNAIMRSAMNHHFKAILEEKGYKVLINDDMGKHKIDHKKLKEKAKENNDAVVERAINDTDESLTSSEKKVKSSMEKRADILHVKINNERFREELSDDRKFTTHLNICSLLNTNHDETWMDKTYKELKVQNAKSNTTKIKLINEVQSLMNISPLCIDDINDVVIPDDKQEVIKKVFRLKEVNLVSMYRSLVPGLIKAKTTMVQGVRSRRYSVDADVMKHHLDLLYHRNKTFANIDQNTMNNFDYEPPQTPKLF